MIYSRWVSPNDGVCLGNIGADEAGLGLLGNDRLMTPWLGNNSGGRKAGGPASTFPRQIFKKIQRRDNSVLVGLPGPACPTPWRRGPGMSTNQLSRFQSPTHSSHSALCTAMERFV